jgi:hypothetical protein
MTKNGLLTGGRLVGGAYGCLALDMCASGVSMIVYWSTKSISCRWLSVRQAWCISRCLKVMLRHIRVIIQSSGESMLDCPNSGLRAIPRIDFA